jgi:hypothetical protein
MVVVQIQVACEQPSDIDGDIAFLEKRRGFLRRGWIFGGCTVMRGRAR